MRPEYAAEDKLRLDACLECAPAVPLAPGMSAKMIPHGLYAVTQHRGSWTTLTDTYNALLGGWLPTTQYQLMPEPIVETYLDGTDVAEAERRTDVRIRIAE